MANIPDFRPAQQADIGGIARLMQQKAVAEHTARQQKRKRQDDLFKGILDAVQQGQQIVANGMAMSQARRKERGRAEVQNILTETPLTTAEDQAGQVTTRRGPVPLPQGVQGPPPIGDLPVSFAETKQGADLVGREVERRDTQPQRLRAALQRAAPEEFEKKAIEASLVTDKPLSLKQLLDIENSKEMLKQRRIANSTSGVLHDSLSAGLRKRGIDVKKGASLKTLLDATKTNALQGRSDAQLNRVELSKKGLEINSFGKLSDKTIVTAQSMGKLFGRDARALAGSQKLFTFMEVIDDALNQPGGPTSQQMASIVTDFTQILTTGGGSQVVSQKIMEHLLPRTGLGTIQKIKSWLTGNPQGAKQQEFVKQFHDEVIVLARVAEEHVRQHQVQVMLANSAVRGLNPERYDKHIETLGLTTEDIANNKFDFEKDREGVFPNFNPFKIKFQFYTNRDEAATPFSTEGATEDSLGVGKGATKSLEDQFQSLIEQGLSEFEAYTNLSDKDPFGEDD